MLVTADHRMIIGVFRQHPIVLATEALWCILFILLAVVGVVFHPFFPILAIWAIVWFIWRVLTWYTTTYSVTSNRNVICRKRLFGAQSNTIPLFGEVIATQTMQGQLLDYGDVTIRQPGGVSYLRCIGNFKDLQLCLEDSSGGLK